jgi:hypothetical protein
MENIKLKFCLHGLNQFFYLNNDTLDYKNLIDELIANFEIKDTNLLIQKLKEDNNEIILEKLKKHLKEKNLVKYLPANSITDNGFNSFIIYNSDPIYLLFDKLILENDVIENEIKNITSFTYMSFRDLMEMVKNINPKHFVIFNELVSHLAEFRNLGCWTILIANIVFSYFDLNEISVISDTISSNIDWIETRVRDYDLSAYNFYQLVYYYKVISDLNNNEAIKADHCGLAKYITYTKPIKCLLFTQCLKRFESFKKKQKFYISNDKVMWVPHIGGLDISINGDIDSVLAKAVESRDYILYKNYFDKFDEYCDMKGITRLNQFKNFPYFVQKDLMHHFMENFLKSEEIKILNHNFNINISLPSSLIVDGKELRTKETFLKIMKENNFDFPILVKYQSNTSFYFKHLATMIFEEKNLDNYINYYNSLDVNNLNCILQSFVNHGGHVIKMYRINQENHIDWRSSLPDINKEFDKNFPEGYWTFKTTNLESETYKELWRKYHTVNKIKDIINYDYIYSVSKAFEKYSGLTLYGLDFLYGYEIGEFYLIDVNAFPGYKIKGIDIGEKMREHVQTYYRNKSV